VRNRVAAVVGALALAATSLMTTGLADAQQTGQIRTSDNYRLGDWTDPIRGKSGPGLAVNPNNRDNVVETQIDLATSECEYNVSTNGGLTWRIGGKLVGPADRFPQGPGSCDVLGHGANQLDNGLEFGSGNTVYAAFSVVPNDAQFMVPLVARSTDGGINFAPGVQTMPVQQRDANFPKIDVIPGGGTNGQDRIVLATTVRMRQQSVDSLDVGRVLTTTSNDGGQTWSPPVVASAAANEGNPFGAQEHTHPLFGPNGEIYVAWRTSTSGVPGRPPEPGFLQVARSLDGGQTWTQVNAINVRAEPTFNASSFPRMAIDDRNGNLYLVWAQDANLYGPGFVTADHFMIKTSQVWFLRSTDRGQTWRDLQLLSEPVVAGYDTQTRHPNVDVAPNGRVDVVWHDRRHMIRPRAAGNVQGPACLHTHFPCVESKLGDTYWSFSANEGQSFTESRRISDRSHNNDVGYDYRFSTYWDFGPVVAYPSDPAGNIMLTAWMDSREGNHDVTDTQDIYLARTFMNGTSFVPRKDLGIHSARNLNVVLSRTWAQPGGSEGKQAFTFASTQATRVVIANENDVPGIMAGGVLARANVGPLLITPADSLPDEVRQEIQRVQPMGAYLIGGTDLLSSNIEAQLAELGVPALNVIPDARTTAGSTTVISPGGHFDLADINHSVSGAGVPAGSHLFYVTTKNEARLSAPATATATDVTLTVPRIVRLGGATAEERAAAIARQLDRRTPTEKTSGRPAFDAVIIASPTSQVAPTASALAAHRRLPYLFTDGFGGALPAATTDALAALNINRTLVITGDNAVGQGVVNQLASGGRNPTPLGGADALATSESVLLESVRWGLPTNQVFVSSLDRARHSALLGQPVARIGGLLFAVPSNNSDIAEQRLAALGLAPGLDRLVLTFLESGRASGVRGGRGTDTGGL
jgi:putative cell wall-binding protein